MDKENPRVIVLGAGASCSYKESPTGLRPPLAREIISTYHKLEISENRYVLIGDIVNYVRDTRGINPSDFPLWDEDLEFFLTEIDESIESLALKLKGGKDNSSIFAELLRTTRVYNQLIFLFASIFNEIQNGPVSIPYALLANELGLQDTIVTFNWDTLMDRALMTTNKWSPLNGYCIKPEHIFDDGWKEPSRFILVGGGPQYLKLHGSTNWLTPYHGVNLSTGGLYSLSRSSMDKLFVFVRASRSYETYAGRYWGPYEPFSYCYYPPNLPLHSDDIKDGYKPISVISAIDLPEHGKVTIDDRNVYSMPLIVPPVRNKQYMRYGGIFSELWSRAEAAISGCCKLYVIGYSFPETDMLSRELFLKALGQNRRLRKVVVINPRPERIRELFLDTFGISPSKIEVREEKFDVPLTGVSSLL